jgi:hypothetical protein
MTFTPPLSASGLKLRFRVGLMLFIIGLIASGMTAFFLRPEVDWLASFLGVSPNADLASLRGLRYWIGFVREGLHHSYATYPFLAYGTDWLAFAHLAIAVFFIGPLCRPTEHDWALISGIIACAGVILLALICGPLRGIPPYWRLIDCSFGSFGVVPLLYCLVISQRIKSLPA